MENFTDRSEITVSTPTKEHYTKSGSEISVAVSNGHSLSSSSPTSSSQAPHILPNIQMEDAVFSTTSISKENKVSTDINPIPKAKDHMFSSSSAKEEKVAEILPPLLVPSPKKDEEIRSYYTPGFSIRAWAFEDIKHKKDEPESSKITHVETKERKTSVTSTLTINKNKDFDLEKKEAKQLSSLTFNVGKSPKSKSGRHEKSSVEVMLSKTVDYDLHDLSPQKKELSQATFDIGRKSSSGSEGKEESVTKTLFVNTETKESNYDSVFADSDSPLRTKELNQKNLQKTEEIASLRSASSISTSAKVKPDLSSKLSKSATGNRKTVESTDEWVIISEEENIPKAESKTQRTSALLQQSSPSVVTKPVSAPVEIERKFTVGANTEVKLRKSGAKLKSEKVFTDVYFDNEDYLLTLSDCWLRKRNNVWQMKVPIHSYPKFDVTTKYLELTDEQEIKTFIEEKFKTHFDKKSKIFNCLKKLNLVDFATITTTRKTFALDGCEVDLDCTNDGFQVGEIEIMAASPSEIPAALRTIDKVAKELGWSPLQLVL